MRAGVSIIGIVTGVFISSRFGSADILAAQQIPGLKQIHASPKRCIDSADAPSHPSCDASRDYRECVDLNRAGEISTQGFTANARCWG